MPVILTKEQAGDIVKVAANVPAFVIIYFLNGIIKQHGSEQGVASCAVNKIINRTFQYLAGIEFYFKILWDFQVTRKRPNDAVRKIIYGNHIKEA